MKLSYFGYSIERCTDGRHFLMDIKPFLQAFCAYDNTQFKNSFEHTGERVYLLRKTSAAFMFLITRDNDIIKK